MLRMEEIFHGSRLPRMLVIIIIMIMVRMVLVSVVIRK